MIVGTAVDFRVVDAVFGGRMGWGLVHCLPDDGRDARATGIWATDRGTEVPPPPSLMLPACRTGWKPVLLPRQAGSLCYCPDRLETCATAQTGWKPVLPLPHPDENRDGSLINRSLLSVDGLIAWIHLESRSWVDDVSPVSFVPYRCGRCSRIIRHCDVRRFYPCRTTPPRPLLKIR